LRHLIIACLFLALAVGCESNSAATKDISPATGPEAAPRPALPKLGDKSNSLGVAKVSGETTGTTYPLAVAQVAPNASGVIATIAVDEGARVKKGQLLFRLRTTGAALRVKQARAVLKSAEVNLGAIKVERDRMQKLFEKQAIDRASWDGVSAKYDAAVVGIEQANVAVSLARKALGDATVRSPLTGVVTKKLKNEGEMATMMPPSVIVIVEDHSALELRFRLPERLLAELKVGDVVPATFASLGITRESKVIRIGSNVDLRTRTFEVVSMIANEDGSLKAGMLATVNERRREDSTK